MKKFAFIILIQFAFILLANASKNDSNISPTFKTGERLEFKFYYNSLLTGNVLAGYMNSEVFDYESNSNYFKVMLDARTRRAYSLFFKVEDKFTTYISKKSLLPIYFAKKLREGKYTADHNVKFFHKKGYADFTDNEKKETKTVEIPDDIHDLISSIYYMRSQNYDTIEIGDTFNINFFLNGKIYKTDMKFIGYKTIETDLGNVDCMMFKPRVLKGTVFKEEEPLTVYVSNDKNRLPIMAESEIRVGSLKVMLTSFKGLSHPTTSIKP